VISKKIKLHAYQKRAVKFITNNNHSGLLLQPGLGKTAITLTTIKKLIKSGEIKKALVLCPLRVAHSVWQQEAEKWTDFNDLRIVVLHGKHKDKLLEAGDYDIAVINYEGLDWLTQVEKYKDNQGRVKVRIDLRRWRKLGFDMLVLDELSKMKAHGTGRFKVMREILSSFTRRVGLTGSPASNSLLDLWGQMYMLDLGASLGQYITHYRTTFFTPDYSGFNWKIKPGKEEEIYARIAPIVLRMKANDYLELPALINNYIKVEIPPTVMKFYKELEDDFLAMIDNKLITAANAAVASGKCRQVANGGIYLTPDLNITGFKIPKEKRNWLDLHNEKIDALADLVEELQGQQLLVAYDFNHDLARIQAKFGKDVAYIGSGVSTKKAKEYEAQWNSGELRLLFGHPQSVAHGLNLQGECNNVCFHSLPWSYEFYEQFFKRVLRQGNKHQHVFVHHIIAENTIDELVVESLQEKENTQNALFDGLKKLARSRR
jgi:SNF2 family DNA or RNA helicase